MISPEKVIGKPLKEAWYIGGEVKSKTVIGKLVHAVFDSKAKLVIIDGFPRCKQNWKDWNS